MHTPLERTQYSAVRLELNFRYEMRAAMQLKIWAVPESGSHNRGLLQKLRGEGHVLVESIILFIPPHRPALGPASRTALDPP